ncbi:MAG: glycosyltransferase [Candidatus Brocadia sp.]
MSDWQSEPDNGKYDAMNKGIKRATGDIIAIFNSDDTWLPCALKQVASAFSCNPDAGIVSGSIEVWEDSLHGTKVVLKSSVMGDNLGLSLVSCGTGEKL